MNVQRERSPDVNTFVPESSPAVESPNGAGRENDSTDTERLRGSGATETPPDTPPPVPVEEPPDTDRSPMGEVEDSPKKIAS